MKLREKYRTVIESDEEDEQIDLIDENTIENDTLPTPPVASRPSLISITEDHAVNILSQLTRETPTKRNLKVSQMTA